MHVMSKLYGIAITINPCLFEFKTHRKNPNKKNPQNTRMTEAGLILFRPNEKYHEMQYIFLLEMSSSFNQVRTLLLALNHIF